MALTVAPPLYLIGMKINCWQCDSRMPVVAILAPNVIDYEADDDEEKTVFALSGIVEIPQDILAFIQKRVPTFQLRASHTAGYRYFANTCPQCHKIYGDFYLHCEPGGPFFPTSEQEAKLLYITEIPMTSEIEIKASPSSGLGELILAHGKRI